jgi:hypothetical protein
MGAASCGTTTITKKVWVPNVVTETVPVTTSSSKSQVVNYTVYEQQSTQIPYECTTIAYRSETRTGTKQTVVYADEQRTRTRKVVQYNDEKRTRMRKELTYTTVTKTETVPHVTYKTEQRTKEVSYTYNVPEYTMEAYQTTRYDRVAEEQVEEYTVSVPYTETVEQKVQVCKMVPRLVEQTINPCCGGGSAGALGSGGSAAAGCGSTGCGSTGSGCGCGSAPAPVATGCGCSAPAPVTTGCGC